MNVKVAAARFDEDERKDFIKEVQEMCANVKATFHDGSDYDSSWEFEGPEAEVKHVVEHFFQFTPTFMPFDELIAQIEVNGYVNGKCMTQW